MIKVIVVEDNNAIREGLRILIDGTEGYSCLAVYSKCETMLKEIEKFDADVLLMDIGLPGISGIEGIKKVKKILPDINILMLTVYEENDLIFDAIFSGACGYLVKKTPPVKLLEAIKDASEGGAPMNPHIARKVINFFQKKNQILPSEPASAVLTQREKEVLTGLVDGNSFKSIADSLYISVETVRFHFRNIYKKLHVHSQSEAVAKALKEGLI